jgi:DNA-binding transcriptional MerR regulator
MRSDGGDCSERTLAWAAEPAASPADETALTIAQLSREFGVTLRTLRFYEARGFISPRRQGAARRYRQADRERLATILKAKQLGFTLREISDLLASGDGATGGQRLNLSRQQCTEQINFLERQKRDIDNALAELRRAYTGHYVNAIEREVDG